MNAARAAVLVSTSLVFFLWRPAQAAVLPWSTAPAVGPSEIVYTLDLSCTTGGLVCNALDGYVDQQTAVLTGGGEIDLDGASGTLRFLSDGVVDLQDGMGPRPTYAAVDATDLVFEPIPFIGAPATEAGAVFALTNPLFVAGGPLVPGSYPISLVVSYSAIADIVGPVDAYLPDLLLPPSDVTLTGTLEILSTPGGFIYQLRNLTTSLMVENPTTLLGEDVLVSVTADMTLNLRGLLASSPPSIIPALGVEGAGALAVLLGIVGVRVGRQKSEERS